MGRLLTTVVLVFGVTSPALAQDAEALFREGTEALQDGRLPEARAALEQSLELNPHPSTAFNLMMTLTDLDELLAASALCHQLLEEGFGPLEERRVQVERLCEALWEDIPVLEVVATGAPTIQLRIDGESHGELENDRPMTRQLDPGRHVVRVDAPEHRGDERAIDLRRSERSRVELRVVSAQDAKRRRIWMALAIAGGVVLAGTAVALGIALSRGGDDLPVDAEAPTLSDGAMFRF